MKTGWESMWVGSIIYFIPVFFVLNPALVLQGDAPYLEAVGLMTLAGIGTLFICGGIQGYQAFIGDLRRTGVLEWPLRFLLIVGGFILATPGGGGDHKRHCCSKPAPRGARGRTRGRATRRTHR